MVRDAAQKRHDSAQRREALSTNPRVAEPNPDWRWRRDIHWLDDADRVYWPRIHTGVAGMYSRRRLLHFDHDAIAHALLLQPGDLIGREHERRPRRANLPDDDLVADLLLRQLGDIGQRELSRWRGG